MFIIAQVLPRSLIFRKSSTGKWFNLKSIRYNYFPALVILHNLYSIQASAIINSNMVGDVKRFDNIVKSDADKRLYRGLELSNGLKALLVSDPTTDKSAASLTVEVGSLSEPNELPGLAHFLEHMLFLGSAKYPAENDYQKFVSEHSGSTNAFTSSHQTNYFFDIGPDYLRDALDRFAQFFIAPLFTESATDREVNAVNSEHEKNIPVDAWRMNQLQKSLSRKDHPYSHFFTGDKNTLDVIPKSKGIVVRDELLKFHKKWYSANIMSLVILGKESLDELESWTVPLFGGIANSNVERVNFPVHPFGPEQLKQKIYIVPIMDIRTLTLVFPTPDVTQLYRSKPMNFISHLIGHEGPGSLLSVLHEHSLCNALSAGQQRLGPGFGAFSINMDLPLNAIQSIDEIIALVFQPDDYVSHLVGHEGPGSLLSILRDQGFANAVSAGALELGPGFGAFAVSIDFIDVAHDYIDDIILIFFQYIKLLKEKGVKEWIFDESKQVGKITFQFKDKNAPRQFVTHYSGVLREYDWEDVLRVAYWSDDFEPELIHEYLDMLNPENLRVVVVSKKFEDVANETEEYYGTKYKVEPISEDSIMEWKHPSENKNDLWEKLHLPPKNEFIPDDFELYPQDPNVGKFPMLIQDTSHSRFWFKQDDEYLLPKENVMLELISPMASSSPLTTTLMSMYVMVLKDFLNEYSYAAGLAGLDWSISNTMYGLTVTVSGFNQKLPILLDKILEKLCNLTESTRFSTLKEKFIRSLKNFAMDQPYNQSKFYMTLLLIERGWDKNDLLAAAERMTSKQLLEFATEFTKNIYIQGLIHGNSNKKKAEELITSIESHFPNSSVLLPQQLLHSRHIELKPDTGSVFNLKNQYHVSSCVHNYYQCGPEDSKTNAMVELFAQITNEPTFHVLRTQEQLGYIVQSGVRRANGVQGFYVLVQSDRHPLYVDNRVERFIESIDSLLNELSDEEFDRHKNALAQKRLEKPKQLSGLTLRYWSEISVRIYNFDRANIEVSALRSLSKSDVAAFYKEHFSKVARNRRKLGIHILSTHSNPIVPEEIFENMTEIKDLIKFKTSHSLYPLAQPFAPLDPIGTKSKL